MKQNDSIGRALSRQLESVTLSGERRASLLRAVRRERPHARRGLAIALVLALVLVSATGFASGLYGSVLDFLGLGQDVPTQPIGQTVHAAGSGGVTVTACDALWQGDSFSVGLYVKSERPVLLVADSLEVNGVRFDMACSNLEDMWTREEPFTYGFTAQLSEDYVHPSVDGASAAYDEAMRAIAENGEAMVNLHLTTLLPRQRTVQIDTYADDRAAMWAEIDACVARGDTPVDADEPHSPLVSSAFLTEALGEAFDCDSPAVRPNGDVQALEAYANMEVIFTGGFMFGIETAANE